jgi:hypothetical protein
MSMVAQSIDSFDNVIAFNEARARSGSGSSQGAIKRHMKPESVGVINDCRDLALKRICAALAATFDKIEDELFELAEKSHDREAQNMYLDARSQARDKRKDIEGAFRQQFVSFFEKKVNGDTAPKAAVSFSLDSLSLVEDDALSENIAVNDIAKRLTDKCDEELRALSQRMGFLMSEPELADEANPIAPDTVVKALKAACDQITAGFQTRLTVMKMVEQHMANEMLSVYRDINKHLVANKIMPVVRPTFRRSTSHAPRRTQAANASGGAAPQEARGNDNFNFDLPIGMPPNVDPTGGFGAFSAAQIGMPPANQALELFHTLQQLMAGGVSFDSAPMPREYSSVTTGSFAPVPPSSSMFAGGSTGLSNGGAATANGVASSGKPLSGDQASGLTSSALISVLSQYQHQLGVTTTASHSAASLQPSVASASASAESSDAGQSLASALNVLRELKAQGVAQGSSQVDAMTIDIVAMLFDYVFDDKAIPDTIKALIARLQIPVLKVAILDKSFFSKKTHSVRRLLDSLAQASVAFAGEASREDPLYIKIEHIVERVQNEFDTDVGLFDRMLEDFDEFLKARETANAEMIEQSARAMHEREKREMARLIGQSEMDRLSSRPDLPAPVTAMLKGPWARVLERVYLRDGGRSARFNEALETAEQLVWSVHQKADAAQRRDLVSALPLLLRRLQEGLDVASVDSVERDRFFSALVDCHAAAVKAGLRGESVSALFAAAHGDAAVAPLFEKLLNEERAREAAAANIDRTGVARIQFTEAGIHIEELVAGKSGAALDITDVTAASEELTANVSTAQSDALLFDSTEPEAAAELSRGTWVEFAQANGAKIRAKLSWVSPLKGMYLFTNPGATEALSIAPAALARQLKRGSARVLEESSLIDRAVDRMVNSLSGASASA